MAVSADWAEKDFYKTLGVAKDAAAADIKKAYRRIARDNHPDTKPGDTAAETRFKAASEAYHVLSDTERRSEYDQFRAAVAGGGMGGMGGMGGGFPGGRRPTSGPGQQGQPFDLDDLLRQGGGAGPGGLGDMFGDLFGGGGQRRARRTPTKGADVTASASIGFLESLAGTTITLRLRADGACSTCNGTGGKPGTSPKVCSVCDGAGEVVDSSGGAFAMREVCPKCRGRQLVYDTPCPTCMGSGRTTDSRTVSARLPAGVKDGQRIRLTGKGAPGEDGGPAGDLLVNVKVAAHPVFSRDGDNVVVDLPVTFDEAALGATVKAPTPGGQPVSLKIAPGTGSGRRLRVRGKGAPRRDGSRGDLLVTVQVQVPAALSDEARTAVEAYRRATGGADVRAEVLADGSR
ncbi:DnaJ domain-containing protein [Nocardioidaceae bacterium]|nr:DnaJ domain-containing protein [Nocardioidaceae bacterium]